jgi:Tol biopolymer transport system component
MLSLMDWTADGRFLAVRDARQGKSALYLLPMKEGAADGEAAFVRYGAFSDGYSTAAGALVVQDNTARQSNVNAFIASIEPEGHLGSWRPLNLETQIYPRASFSPDGRQIAYTGPAADPTRRSLVVLDLATGQNREVYQSAYGSLVCLYSLHNPRVFCSVQKGKGESELFSVEVESGAVEHIVTFPETRNLVLCGRDDQIFYFSPNGWHWGTFEPPIIEWNRSTGQEAVIANDRSYYQAPSPDGRLMVGLRDGRLSVRPTSGGDWAPLVSGIGMNVPVFTMPDGKWVFYQDKDAAGKYGLFRVPITGGEPQRLGGSPGNLYSEEYFFSPDARQILTVKGATDELWLLENFVPSARK